MKELRTMLLRLKGEFMSEDGSSVDYFSMGKSESFQNYKELAAGLRYILKKINSLIRTSKLVSIPYLFSYI